MPAPNLNLSKFVSRITETDLARPNLFTLVISDANTGLGANDGVLDTPLGSTWPLSGINLRGIGDVANDILLSRSETYRRVTGAWSPEIVRGIAGSDYLNILGLGNNRYLSSKDVAFMVKSVNIPGMSYSTTESRFRQSDGVQHVITGKTLDPVTVRFYLSTNHAERYFFEMWANQIYDSKTNQVAFKSMYEKNIEIFTYDRQGIAQTKTMLHGAFPIRINSTQLDMDSRNEVLVFEVELQYRYMTSDLIKPSEQNAGDLLAVGKSRINRIRNLINVF